MPVLTFGSLFAGIGGLDLGLSRAGLGRAIWQVEIDPFRRGILAKHWPEAERFEDVRTVGAHNLAPVDGICGGSPCQGFSTAGKRKGFDDERSGLLWSEMRRIVGELRPRWVIWENVREARRCGALAVIARDLGELGYRVEDLDVTGGDVGAPQRRPRVFVLAVRPDDGREGSSARDGARGALDEQQGDDVDGRGLARPAGGLRPPAEPGMDRDAVRLPDRLDRWPAPPGQAQAPWEPRRTVDRGLRGTTKSARIEALGDCVIPAFGELVGRRLADVLGIVSQ